MNIHNPILALREERVGAGAPSWQVAIQTAIREPGELCRVLHLPPEFAERAAAAAEDFPLFVPRGYVARIRQGDPADPLLRQVLPLAEETQPAAGFVPDPVGDAAAEAVPGMLQKYTGRALLITTGRCAVHCRYCFRRHYPYDEAPRSPHEWHEAWDAIRRDPSLAEVILSGGDPLTLGDGRLGEMVEQIATIGHVRRLRIHTRLPVLIPERVTEDLVRLLADTRLTPLVVIHANHAQEIDRCVARAIGRLVNVGVPVLNQAVLLAGVNDSVEAQAALWERLVDLRVWPYYLHQLDRVAGAAHFEVPVERGRQILEALRGRLPGYAVPRYVEEVPAATSKLPLA